MRRNYKQLNKLLKQNENLYSENDLNTIIVSDQKEQESKEYLEKLIFKEEYGIIVLIVWRDGLDILKK